MKTIIWLIVACLTSSIALGEEVVINIDRMAVLVPDQGQFSNRAAIHFAIPEAVYGREIAEAVLQCSLDFTGIQGQGDSVLEFLARDVTTDWTETATWSSPWFTPGGDVDTLSFYSYTITMSPAADIFMDMTAFVRSVAQDGRENYGLMLMPFKYDQPDFNVPVNIFQAIGASAQIRIVYQ